MVIVVVWDEWEGIVMVIIVFVGVCVCDIDFEKRVKKKIFNSSFFVYGIDFKNFGKVFGER